MTPTRWTAAFVAVIALSIVSGCATSDVMPHFELASDGGAISYINSDRSQRFSLRACAGTTLTPYVFPKGRTSPNGTWSVFEAHAPYADETDWFVSSGGLAVTATDFPRAFRFPIPAILSYDVWTTPGGQRIRYEYYDGTRWHFVEPLLIDHPKPTSVHPCLFAQSRNPDKPTSKYGIPDAPKNHQHR